MFSNSARAHLSRAEQLLATGERASMFYAAFELRCGIESRMSQYLLAWQDADKKLRSGWRMADLHRNIERKFRLGKLYARWAVHDPDSGALRVCFYYTPVTPELKKMGEKLGDYLHFIKDEKESDEIWWDTFRKLLTDCASSLRIAASGIMIGPSLLKTGTNQAHMQLEMPGKMDKDAFLELCGQDGQQINCYVTYPEALPVEIEPEAVMWTF